MIVGLVSCSSDKLHVTAPAREVYGKSQLFRAAAGYCDTHADIWFVLSAKYGIVAPMRHIEWYDLYLGDLNKAERLAWGQRVRDRLVNIWNDQLARESKFPPTLDLHMGKLYRDSLPLWEFESWNWRVRDQLKGAMVGQRLHQYKVWRELAELNQQG